MLKIHFYIGVETGSPLQSELGSYGSAAGAYAFEVDGFPVNADEDLRPEAEPLWRIEDLEMSLLVLEGATKWWLGIWQGTGGYYDYVEFGITPIGQGKLEIKSNYAGADEYMRVAVCDEAEFWPAFAAATDEWMQHIKRFLRSFKTTTDPELLALMVLQKATLRPHRWEKAYADWQAAYQQPKAMPSVGI